jgi:serine/threonine-protein kinase
VTPRQVGSYRIDRLLGVGGMGEVYLAYDTDRDRYVALKLLPEALSGDEEYLRRFQHESHIAARLREPHVIPIHDYGEIDGQLFIDMRLVDGVDIGALLKTDGPIAPERVVHLLGQVAQALDAAHADHLVHRDIKPANILVTESDFVYVVDFGIARAIGARQTPLTITGATIGTLHYMAPERFADQAIDGRADVYSLACVLHECLTGAPPFGGKDLPALIYAHLNSSPPRASGLAEGVPTALDAVIARGMAKDPAERFPSAGLLAAAAREALLTEEPVPAMTQLPAPGSRETPAPAWEVGVTAWQSVAPPPELEPPPDPEPLPDPDPDPDPDPEPAVSRLASSVPDSPTQTAATDGVDAWGASLLPENMLHGTRIDPDVSHLPPDEAVGSQRDSPARGLGVWRLGAILVGVAVLAAVVTLIVTATTKSNTGDSAGASSAAATSAGPSVSPSLAVPTVAEKITVGGTPSYVHVAPNGQFAYVANPFMHVITVLNTATDRVSGVIKIPFGPPQFVSFSPDSRTAYVSVYTTGKNLVHLVVFIDTATKKVTATVSVNNHTPGPSTTSPDGRYLYVPNHNMSMTGSNVNIMDVIDTTTKKLTSTVAVLPNPHGVVFAKSGLVYYVTDHMSTTVTVLNAANNQKVTEIQVGETPHSIAISPDGSRLAITSFSGNEVFVVSTATDKQVATIPVGRNPLAIAYSPDGRYIYTADNEDDEVTVIDAAANRVIGEVSTGKSPTSISLLPNGRQAYVSDENDGTVEVLNLPE